MDGLMNERMNEGPFPLPVYLGNKLFYNFLSYWLTRIQLVLLGWKFRVNIYCNISGNNKENEVSEEQLLAHILSKNDRNQNARKA